jgi:hypothetical protein
MQKSFAEHLALGTYYDQVIDLLDGLVESYQGKYGILTDYEAYPIVNYSDTSQVIEFLDKLTVSIEVLRQDNDDSYLQNQIDTLVELIETTKYKLRFLS